MYSQDIKVSHMIVTNVIRNLEDLLAHLKSHRKITHEGVRFACNHCEYQALQQSNLTLHIQSKHEGVKYACDQCN